MKIVLIFATLISAVFYFFAIVYCSKITRLRHNLRSWVLLTLIFAFFFLSRIIEVTNLLVGSFIVKQATEYIILFLAPFTLFGLVNIYRNVLFYNERDRVEGAKYKATIKEIVNTEEKLKYGFSNELHDRIGPTLALIKLTLSSINVGDAVSVNSLERVNSLIDDTIGGLRKISYELSPLILKSTSLNKAIHIFCDRIAEQAWFSINIYNYFEDEDLELNTKISIYKIATELILNCSKCSGLRVANLHFTRSTNMFLIKYFDDGKGVDSKAIDYGFLNLKSRIHTLDGAVSIKTIIDKGTYLSIAIDLSKNTKHEEYWLY